MEPKVEYDAKEKAHELIEEDAKLEIKEREKKKWEGKARTKLNGISAQKVWDLLEDFCSFHKWLPTIDTCFQVDGIKGQPGLVRYCASTSSPPPLDDDDDDDDDESHEKMMIKWCHEKLLAIDHVEHCMSYEVLDNNMGLKSYVANIKVLGLENGCEIEWCFLADPVDGLTCEDLTVYLSFTLKGMAQRMENALL